MTGPVDDEPYCFNLHRVRWAVTRLLSAMAMDEHPVHGLTISDKCAIPLIRDLLPFFRRVVSDGWPRDARDPSRFRLEAAAQQSPVVLKVGNLLDVGVHPVLRRALFSQGFSRKVNQSCGFCDHPRNETFVPSKLGGLQT